MTTETAQTLHPGTQTVTVDTGRERYDIVIGHGLLALPQCWAGLPRAAQAVVVSNAVARVSGRRKTSMGWLRGLGGLSRHGRSTTVSAVRAFTAAGEYGNGAYAPRAHGPKRLL